MNREEILELLDEHGVNTSIFENTNDDDLEFEAECILEDIFRESQDEYQIEIAILNKEDIFEAITRLETALKEEMETREVSTAFSDICNNLVERFRNEVTENDLPTLTWPWQYSLEFDYTGITLTMKYNHWSYSFDSDGNPTSVDCYSRSNYKLIKAATKRLTVNEFAALYEVEPVTVRQWIRRGKIRIASKEGSEWYIPELTELPTKRGFSHATYIFDELLTDLPEEFAYLNQTRIVYIDAIKGNRDHFDITYAIEGTEELFEKTIDEKSRVALEYYLIKNPLVHPSVYNAFSLQVDELT